MVLLPVVGNKVLIFKLEDVKELRELGIVGVLSGTLAAAPQQNVFLGLPLQLSVEDVIWLVTNKHAKLIDSARYHELIRMSQTDLEDWNESSKVCVSDAKQAASLLAKLEKLNLSGDQLELKRRQIEESSKVKNFVVIPNETVGNVEDSGDIYMSLEEFLGRSSHKGLRENYQVFRAMKDQGFYLLPGIRFGGKYVGYPNDPLRYHAHYIVNPGSHFKLLDLVTSGRLATGVKKVWVIASRDLTEEKEEEENDANDENDFTAVPQKFFSVEWAGFG